MFKKQDTAFWWKIDNYIKDNPEYKNLSIQQKKLIDKGYRLAYYALFQYQLYVGRELNDLSPSDMQEISSYIVENFTQLADFINNQDKTELEFDINDEENKNLFLDLLNKVILPYISEYSFGNIISYNNSSEAIGMITMQLAFKNEYDINYVCKSDETKLYYSPVFPFLMTVLLLDPTNIESMYKNAKNFFTKESIETAYNNGRLISNEEVDYLFASMDRIKDDIDFETLLQEFKKDKWEQLDIVGRFRVVFQLSKYTAIFLKENINSITMLENGENVFDLIKYYLPIILQSAEEFENYQEKKTVENDKGSNFLYPLSFKDFDSKTIKTYFKKMKVSKIEINDKKLTSFRVGVIYSLSKLRLIYSLNKINPQLQKVFIERNKIALVNSLELFNDNFENTQKFYFKYENGFVNSTILSNIIKKTGHKKTDEEIYENKLKPIARIISYLLALDPEIVKKMDYSLEEIVKYYLVCFGPYKKTKISYDKSDIKELTKILIKYSNLDDNNAINDEEYRSTFYLINKLVNFKKKIT